VGEDEEERGMKVSGVLLIKFYLALEIIPRIIVGMDFINPEGFLIESIKPQSKAYEETKKKD